MPSPSRLTGIAGLLLLAVLLLGCGGSGRNALSPPGSLTTGQGNFTLTVSWPEVTRLIPKLTNSIVITLENTTASYTERRVVSRPVSGEPSTVTFTGIPVGQLKVTVNACDDYYGNNTPLASAESVVTINAGQTTAVSLTLNSTIDYITVSTFAPTVNVGTRLSLIPTAYDATNNVVTVATDGWAWYTSNESVVSVDDYGHVTAIGPGTVTLTVVERESGIAATVNLTVKAISGDLIITINTTPVTLSVNPPTVLLKPGEQSAVSAHVGNSPNPRVRWSLREGIGGGSIAPTSDTTATYTAPAAEGTYHIVVTSVADPAVFAVIEARVLITDNFPPVARFQLAPATAIIGETINADASNSSDIEDGATGLQYSWDWGDGYVDDFVATPLATHTYNATGLYMVTLTVKDTQGAIDVTLPIDAHKVTIVPMGIAISPRNVSMGFGITKQFTAKVTGFADTSYTWACTGGAITPEGIYTSPFEAGTYTLTATSTADPTYYDTITINVGSSDMQVIISNPGVSVKVLPAAVTVSVGSTVNFTATVSGVQNQKVTWRVRQITGGSITQTGVYTAPKTPGTYDVIATSMADPTKSCTVPITVQAADLGVTVQ
jgi:uncharacterized protein YjdB